MAQEPELGSLKRRFDKVKDPRMGRARRHRLFDILTIAILAISWGAGSWVDVATSRERLQLR